MTDKYTLDPDAVRLSNDENLAKAEHYIHPVAGETISIPSSGMHALIVEGSHVEICVYALTPGGPTFGITEGMGAAAARALAAELLRMADELDGGRGKQ